MEQFCRHVIWTEIAEHKANHAHHDTVHLPSVVACRVGGGQGARCPEFDRKGEPAEPLNIADTGWWNPPPEREKQFLKIRKQLATTLNTLCHSTRNKILNYNAVQSGKWASTSYSGPNETACSSGTKLHDVTTLVSILTAVKNPNLRKQNSWNRSLVWD